MSIAEVMTICIFYHYSGFKCFKYFYKQGIEKTWKSYFPDAVSYNRFIELKKEINLLLFLFTQAMCGDNFSKTYYVDSTKMAVCDNHRIHKHKVFDGVAQRGKTSMGWFFGLKLHMITDENGEIISFTFSSGNKADNNIEINQELAKNIHSGTIYGDAGYISKKLSQALIEEGILLITKIRKNMKNKLLPIKDKWLLKKRTIIETIFDVMKNIFDLWHTRHRSIDNAFNNAISCITAYQFLDAKPSITKKNQRQIALSLVISSN